MGQHQPGVDEWRELLATGCAQLRLADAAQLASRLADFVQLVLKWSTAFNLTAAKNADDLVRLHVLDSLSVVPYIRGSYHLDVGTGAGFPGIPLAIALPSSRFMLLDSNGKKTRFVAQAITELGLANAEVQCNRVEKLNPTRCFDTIVSRAVAETAQLTAWCAPHCCASGRMVWMKGPNVFQEDQRCPQPWHVGEIAPLEVPGLNAARYAVIVERQS